VSLTRRGKATLAAATVLVVAGGTLAYFVVFPQNAPAFVRNTLSTVGLTEAAPPPPPACPLSGVAAPAGRVPARPALAIKVENAPEARPQAGLNAADIVYEEPVEGGYTRFIAVYQCGEADRVGPVRSGRTTDPSVLRQYGHAVFGYAGGVPLVGREVNRARLIDVNYIEAAPAYTRDDTRAVPHNLYTTTAALWKAGASDEGAPDAVFTYADAWEGKAKKVSSVHLPYSGASDVYWSWSRREAEWLRSHGQAPHVLEGNERVSADNVVVQVVQVQASQIVDAAGNASPDVTLTGSGKAYVFRDGRMIIGRWERATLDDVTRFLAKDGTEIALKPGRTWVELLPVSVAVDVTK
jgi:hypothetical protein